MMPMRMLFVIPFDWFFIVGISGIALLLMASAIISASEVALFSLRPDDLKKCRESDDAAGGFILELLRRPHRLLATILICHDFVNIGIVTISTFLMWDIYTQHPPQMVVGVVTFIVTFVLTFVAEIIPKVYATQHNLSVARRVGGLINLLQMLCRPLSWILLGISSVVERRIKKRGYSATMEELNQVVEFTATNSGATEAEKDILKGIVNFGTLTVKQVMQSRVDITAVDVSLNFSELLDKIRATAYSRIPVYNETIDSIQGILFTKDLLPHLDDGSEFEWKGLLKTAIFVPETKRLDSMLKDFQINRTHMAIVVDEYGGTSGIVTMEDILEEIIGEIDDGISDGKLEVRKDGDSVWTVNGKVSLHTLCRELEIDLSAFDEVKGENETVGGLLLELNKAMPKTGDKVVYDRFVFKVVSSDKRRIHEVEVTMRPQEVPHEDE